MALDEEMGMISPWEMLKLYAQKGRSQGGAGQPQGGGSLGDQLMSQVGDTVIKKGGQALVNALFPPVAQGAANIAQGLYAGGPAAQMMLPELGYALPGVPGTVAGGTAGATTAAAPASGLTFGSVAGPLAIAAAIHFGGEYLNKRFNKKPDEIARNQYLDYLNQAGITQDNNLVLGDKSFNLEDWANPNMAYQPSSERAAEIQKRLAPYTEVFASGASGKEKLGNEMLSGQLANALVGAGYDDAGIQDFMGQLFDKVRYVDNDILYSPEIQDELQRMMAGTASANEFNQGKWHTVYGSELEDPRRYK